MKLLNTIEIQHISAGADLSVSHASLTLSIPLELVPSFLESFSLISFFQRNDLSRFIDKLKIYENSHSYDAIPFANIQIEFSE